ncbi:hypothetical protein QUB05_04715 [Microcoleus sp. F10-C6]|uniref:hypothetical protein n=1 Tax=unclassified Microcoleus TaxID=2642155 RepID=UPI002FD77A7F
MSEPDFETKQKTLRLRDAFRVLAWEVFETNPKNRENLNLRYTKFYSRWVKGKIRSMNLLQLEELAVERGFSVEGLLFYRECYYSIAQPYPPEMFVSND